MEQKINSKIVGGHTIYSEWPLIGGEASGFVNESNLIRKQGVRKGDKLILTKPIGLQAIMAAYRLQKDSPEMLEGFSSHEIDKSHKERTETLMKYPFKNLIFEGGGVKGVAYVGALEALQERKILNNVKRVGGTSAGAINAVLIALGFTLKEIEEI